MIKAFFPPLLGNVGLLLALGTFFFHPRKGKNKKVSRRF